MYISATLQHELPFPLQYTAAMVMFTTISHYHHCFIRKALESRSYPATLGLGEKAQILASGKQKDERYSWSQ